MSAQESIATTQEGLVPELFVCGKNKNCERINPETNGPWSVPSFKYRFGHVEMKLKGMATFIDHPGMDSPEWNFILTPTSSFSFNSLGISLSQLDIGRLFFILFFFLFFQK